jgi:hypothetical protein
MRFSARRLFLLGAVLTALAMLMAPALAGADDDDDDDGGAVADRAFCAPPGPPENPPRGECFITGTLDFDFDASSGPLGQNPTGSFVFESLPFHFEGDVTCLQVTGMRASVGGVITAAHDSFFVGRGFAFTVLDNAPLGPDRISFQFAIEGVLPVGPPPGPLTPNCGSSREPIHDVMGDIVVQDNVGGGDDDEDDDDDEGDDEDDG